MDLQAAQARIAELEAQNKALAQQHREGRITALAQKVSLTDDQRAALVAMTDAQAFETAVTLVEALASQPKTTPLPAAMTAPMVGTEPSGDSLDDRFNAFMKGA